MDCTIFISDERIPGEAVNRRHKNPTLQEQLKHRPRNSHQESDFKRKRGGKLPPSAPENLLLRAASFRT